MDATVLYAAFGSLRQSFSENSSADVSWVLNGYSVVFAALLIPSGRLADLKGRRRVFQWGVALFLIGSLACGASSSLSWLIAARVLQAAGAALLSPASFSLVLDAFPGQQRTKAIALWGAVGGLAASLGPGLGSLLVEHAGWRWAFFINVVPAVWSLWRSRQVTEGVTAEVNGRLDLPGAAVLALATAAVALGLVQVRSEWGAAEIGGALWVGVGGFAMLVAWSKIRKDGILDLSLFKFPAFLWGNMGVSEILCLRRFYEATSRPL
ncbi:MFS transporter [Roseateles noduli]|uniref:MFS transporter n=1 Tax=Roseateles noduli TaxID=2052484 RepID=UPI003D6592E7